MLFEKLLPFARQRTARLRTALPCSGGDCASIAAAAAELFDSAPDSELASPEFVRHSGAYTIDLR